MPADFKIFQIESRREENHEKIQAALKQALQDLYSSSLITCAPPHPYDLECNFFFRTKEGILWARIFYESLSHVCFENLIEEFGALADRMKEKISVCVFFPSVGRGIAEAFRSAANLRKNLIINSATTRFFEYSFLWSQTEEEGLALKQWHLLPEAVSVSVQSPAATAGKLPEDYHFFKYARLSAPELEALLEIAHRLKKA
ncbi:MAG: hypothetical protein HYZ84_05180 [Candidatus Omnitrophica bacterium]|nr:hypothetical protein [Candidatus Omnitrophota bacterium]